MTSKADAEPQKPTDDLLEAWKKSEDVAMHFNNLLLGFRLKAIGGIAVGAILAVGLKLEGTLKPWVIFFMFVSLAIIWALIWATDYLYYYRLLAGAVDELLRLEQELKFVRLSHLIERRVQGGGQPKSGEESLSKYSPKHPGRFPSWPLFCFYAVPLLVLMIIVTFTYPRTHQPADKPRSVVSAPQKDGAPDTPSQTLP